MDESLRSPQWGGDEDDRDREDNRLATPEVSEVDDSEFDDLVVDTDAKIDNFDDEDDEMETNNEDEEEDEEEPNEDEDEPNEDERAEPNEDEKLELPQGIFVEYNRQIYQIPEKDVVRDHGRALAVKSIEQLNAMAQTGSATRWPNGGTLDCSKVVVVKGKIKGGDSEVQNSW